MQQKRHFAAFILTLLLLPCAFSQSDGNPNGWDRRRRCDLFDYDPPCGICEGYGGIPYGDENDQIDLSRCTPVAAADEVDPETLVRPVWGSRWTLPEAREILIGPKNDEFCFVVFPGDDSVGPLCYVPQSGSKYYDMEVNKAFRQEIIVESPIINQDIETTVMHQGPTMWIVNKFGWIGNGNIDQCVCVTIREGGNSSNPNPIYPINPSWVDNLVYIGREVIGVEYLSDDLTDVELDHWAFGPHHLWSYPENGQILRMWQPFNGLQVYRDGVNPGEVDEGLFDPIPPQKCVKGLGSATFRVGCDDEGYPIPDKQGPSTNEKPMILHKDQTRAREKVPRHDYKGVDFTDMSHVLNGWLNSSYDATPCEMWSVEELQELQAILLIARDSQFDDIYQETEDNRRLRHHILTDIQSTWAGLNRLAADDKDPMLRRIRRDGHCHEAVMWFVHHLTEDMKELLSEARVRLPLLSHHRHHDCSAEDGQGTAKGKICEAYREQVTCADCHTDVDNR